MAQHRWLVCAVTFTIAALLDACGGGGGNDDPPPSNNPPPNNPVAVTLSIADAELTEGDSGETSIEFTVSASPAPPSDINVDYSTADDSAEAGSDYTAASGTVTVVAGTTTATIAVAITGDTDAEFDESFTVSLDRAISSSDVTVTIATGLATGLIRNNDAAVAEGRYLNDTGITSCANETMNGVNCDGAFPGQDAEFGTDVTNNDPADGRVGFSFTKLDGLGRPLADQSVSYDVQLWSCVRDDVTGLIWEVKTDDTDFRDRNWTYSWYNSSGVDDGGVSGRPNGGACHDSSNCDTEKFLAILNAGDFCGASDWRIPTRGELVSIVDYGAAAPPFIDTDYFPNALAAGAYWTGSTANSPSLKRIVTFYDGGSTNAPTSRRISLRAVRGGD